MTHLQRMPESHATWPADLPHGLYPMFISPETGLFTSSEVTLGARADSLYEYLLKQWLLSARTDVRMRMMYDQSVAAIRTHLVRRAGSGGCVSCARGAVAARRSHRAEDPRGAPWRLLERLEQPTGSAAETAWRQPR